MASSKRVRKQERPGAPAGNQNRRGIKQVAHARLAVSFSGKTLDALYARASLHEGGNASEQQVRDYVRRVVLTHLKEGQPEGAPTSSNEFLRALKTAPKTP